MEVWEIFTNFECAFLRFYIVFSNSNLRLEKLLWKKSSNLAKSDVDWQTRMQTSTEAVAYVYDDEEMANIMFVVVWIKRLVNFM